VALAVGQQPNKTWQHLVGAENGTASAAIGTCASAMRIAVISFQDQTPYQCRLIPKIDVTWVGVFQVEVILWADSNC